MFNLDQAIAQWRQQMLNAGLKSPVPLDELENHLRADIQEQMRSGQSVKEAFEVATRRIGEGHALKSEFAKARKAPKALRKLMGFACVVLLGFIFLLSGFTFFQMQMSLGEQILSYAAVTFTLVAACGWRYAVPVLPGVPDKRKGVAVGRAGLLFGIICTALFTKFILPD